MESTRPKIESHDPIFFSGTRARSRVSGNDRLFARGSEFGPNPEIPASPVIQLFLALSKEIICFFNLTKGFHGGLLTLDWPNYSCVTVWHHSACPCNRGWGVRQLRIFIPTKFWFSQLGRGPLDSGPGSKYHSHLQSFAMPPLRVGVRHREVNLLIAFGNSRWGPCKWLEETVQNIGSAGISESCGPDIIMGLQDGSDQTGKFTHKMITVKSLI